MNTRRVIVVGMFAGCALGCARPPAASAVTDAGGYAAVEPMARLEFKIEGRALRSFTLGELELRAPPETVTGYDPYYQRVKRFRALPLDRVLAAGFAGETRASLATRHFVLRARDGYTVPVAGEKLLEPGGYLAERDLDAPAWEPVGPQRANPGPVYLVWAGTSQTNLETHPRPWQLAAIEIARFESVFPHTVPTGVDANDAASRGFALFVGECVRCHAINREGGRVGPDLNVPLSIVEYRPEAQIRAYIRNPLAFRYSAMPAHPHFTDADLDGLVAYFRAMSARKHDPDARSDGGADT